ncbi:MAG: sigma-70 family RNA polymerase sigma factor [Planctomycetota bacterium]
MHQVGSEPSGTVFQPRRHLHDAVARYHRPLVAYAFSQTGDLERARDAAQDTLLRLCQQPAERLEHDILPRLAPWLFTVCRNRVIDLHRKESRMTANPGIEQDAVATAEPGPAEHAAAHDQKSQLLVLVASLPTKHREVVQLRFQGGLAYKDIAEVTGHSVSHVGVLLHEAIVSLRQQLTALNA